MSTSFVTQLPVASPREKKCEDIYGTKWFIFFTNLTMSTLLIAWFWSIFLYLAIPGGLVTVVCLAWIISSPIKQVFLWLFFKPINPSDKAILITGCDQGIGHGIALKLNEAGFKVFASCFNEKSLGAQSLKNTAAHPNRMIVFKLDVTQDGDIDSAHELIRLCLNHESERLWAVINNAGLSRTGKLEWGSFDHHFQQLFEVNTFGVVKVTRKFLPMLRESRGRVIIISSLGGRVASACMTAYSMTKNALISFADGLRQELRQFGVRVISIEPAFARTPMTDLEVSNQRIDEIWSMTSPEVQQAYGLGQVEDLKVKVKALSNGPLGLDETYQDIVKCILRSVTSPAPEYTEQPASIFQKPINFIVQMLPREWVDCYFLVVGKILDLIGKKS